MLICAIHIIKGKAVGKLVVVNLYPFVIELRKIHHDIAFRTVQLGGGAVLVKITIVVTQISDSNLAIFGFLAKATAELGKDHLYNAGVDFAGDVLRITLGLIERNPCINDLFVLKRHDAAG